MSDLFLTVLRMSLTAGLVILMVLALRLCLRRAPRIFSYVLWSVVLVRLLCPVSISAPVSALGLAEAVWPELSGWTEMAGESAVPDAALSDETTGGNSTTDYTIVQQNGQTTTRYTVSYDKTEQTSSELNSEKILKGLTFLWLGGVACMLGYGAVSMLRLRRRLRCSVRERGNVYLADDLSEPCVVGLLRPRIYLPSGLEAGERDCALLHERHHIRRGDPLIRSLAYLALCVHWFNPLAWAAFVLSGHDMESSCDEAVLRQADGDIRAEYAASLLNLSAGRRLLPVGELLFADNNPKNRIRHIMNYRKPAFWGVLAAAAVCVVGIVCLATNPAKETTAETETAEIMAAEQTAIQEAEAAEQAAQKAEEALAAEQAAIQEAEAEEQEAEAQVAALEAELADEEEAKVAVHGGRTALLEIKAREVENLQQRMEEFCLAYFNGDAETLKEFLAESYSGDAEVWEGSETVESITMKDITGLPDVSTYASDEKYELSKPFMLPSEDSMTYLTVDFVNEAGEWKVHSYGLEK